MWNVAPGIRQFEAADDSLQRRTLHSPGRGPADHPAGAEAPFAFCLEPNCFVLGRTLEHIELPILRNRPTCLAARIEGKSSRARFGILIHFTAPTVHPGFKGTLTLEMINLGPASFMLKPGMAIAQLIVEEVKGCPVENPSQFQGQQNPAG